MAPTLPPTSKQAPEAQETAPPMMAPPIQPATVKTPTPPKPQPRPVVLTVPVLAPRPPYQNTVDAWKEKKNAPKKMDQQDVEMQDTSKSKAGYHFTSTIQDMADGDAIQTRILDTIVTLPLCDIIGISADLQKQFANLTKTR